MWVFKIEIMSNFYQMQDDSNEKKYAFTEEESNTNYQRLGRTTMYD